MIAFCGEIWYSLACEGSERGSDESAGKPKARMGEMHASIYKDLL